MTKCPPLVPERLLQWRGARARLAACSAAALLAACGGGGGGGGGDSGSPQAITPRAETLAAVDVRVREGQSSASQSVLVPNTGVVGSYSWDVLTTGPVQARAELVAGGVQIDFTVQGFVPTNGAQIEVRYCNVVPCTPQNSLRRIVPLRVDVQRGLSWRLPGQLFFGGQGLRLADQFVNLGLPAEPGTLEVQALEGPGSAAPSAWLQAEVQAGASAQERVLRLASPSSDSLALGEYRAHLRARYVFADGSTPLQLAADFFLQVRPPGCRLPESSPGTPPTFGVQWGPNWNELTSALPIRLECWGIPASAAQATVDVPWLTAALRGSGLQLEAVLELDRAQAASLPSALRPALQLRVSSAVQADALIPFTLDIRFADVQAVSPASVRAGAPSEVLLTGANLGTQLTPLLLDAAGQPVPGVSLTPLRQQACSVTGCEVVVAVPALPAGDWRIGYEQLPGLQRPTGLLRVVPN